MRSISIDLMSAEERISFSCSPFGIHLALGWETISGTFRLGRAAHPNLPLIVAPAGGQVLTCDKLLVFACCMKLHEAKVENEKFLRLCTEGLAARVGKLIQALQQGRREQVRTQCNSLTRMSCMCDAEGSLSAGCAGSFVSNQSFSASYVCLNVRDGREKHRDI